MVFAAAVVVVSSGCTDGAQCTEDSACGAEAICGSEGRCLSTVGCEPGCEADELCLEKVCTARYAGIEVSAPGALTGELRITARLQLTTNGRLGEASTLRYLITGPETAAGELTRNGDVFEGTWSGGPDGAYTAEVWLPGSPVAATAAFTLDRTGPALSIVVAAPPTRREGSAEQAAEADPALPGAHRRDEKVWITITGPADVVAQSVQLHVIGDHLGDAGAVLGPFAVDGGNGCAGAYCGAFELDLAQPELRGARGWFGLVATASDGVGNTGTTDGGLPVTRFKWNYQMPQFSPSLYASPALTSAGDLVTAARLPNGGVVLALRPDGSRHWQTSTTTTYASPVVGAEVDGVQPIYMAASPIQESNELLVLRSDTGAATSHCADPSGPIFSSPALVRLQAANDSAPVEGIAYLSQSRTLYVSRPGATTPCLTSGDAGTGDFTHAIATTGSSLFYGDVTGNLRGLRFDPAATAIVPLEGFPVALDAGTSSARTYGLAIADDQIITGNQRGGLYGVPVTGGEVSWTAFTPARSYSPTINNDGLVAVGLEDGTFGTATLGVSAGLNVAGVVDFSTIEGAPTWGQDGNLYLATGGGEFQVWNPQTLEQVWSDDTIEFAGSAIPLDCARAADGAKLPGRPGVAYVQHYEGQIRAYVVDARGMDVTSPWPKYQHDPRNTGSTATPLAPFACP